MKFTLKTKRINYNFSFLKIEIKSLTLVLLFTRHQQWKLCIKSYEFEWDIDVRRSPFWPCLLSISTSIWVLHTPNAGEKNSFFTFCMPKSYKKGKKQDICCTIVQKIHKGHFKELYKGEQALKASFHEFYLF